MGFFRYMYFLEFCDCHVGGFGLGLLGGVWCWRERLAKACGPIPDYARMRSDVSRHLPVCCLIAEQCFSC